MSYDFVIIGGGCYGSYYVNQLLEARARNKLDWTRIAVLDRDPDCAVAHAAPTDVDVVETEWTEFGATAFADPATYMVGQLVPAPIAPHVVRHWLTNELRAAGADVRDVPWSAGIPTELPFADVTPKGELVLSWAPGLCPTNCVEPRTCPLTSEARTWDMPDTVADLASKAGLDHIETFVCRHFAYGVGTIDLSMIRRARERLIALRRPSQVGLATVSGCHGLLGVVRWE